jgi:HAD superfamily phosphoserine phosphatase-like hydrolase
MVDAFKANIKGVEYGVFVDVAADVVDEQWKRVYRYTRDLLRDLKAREYYLLAISHSPKAILDFFCPRLGFDKVYGVMYELGPNDRFTGGIVDEHLIFNKASIVKRAIEQQGLSLAHSIGVGDTESDIPFLELVQKPVCFNPNQKLYRYAKRMEWKVVVERKDVVYEL